jgi:hypothetical protein
LKKIVERINNILMNDNEFKKPAAYKNTTAMEARPILKAVQPKEENVNLLTRMFGKLKFW